MKLPSEKDVSRHFGGGRWEGTTVQVEFRHMVPLLLKAAMENQAWLHDFDGEVVAVGRDLYDVLCHYNALEQESRRAA